jgi:hypothetical protein
MVICVTFVKSQSFYVGPINPAGARNLLYRRI